MKVSFKKFNERELVDLTKDLLEKRGYSLKKEEISLRPQPDLFQTAGSEDKIQTICEVVKFDAENDSALNRQIDSWQALFNTHHPDEFIVVFFSELPESKKQYCLNRLGPSLRERIKIFSPPDVEEMLKAYPDVHEKYFPQSWHVYYSMLSKELVHHYLTWRTSYSPSSPGLSLLENLLSVDRFKEENKWVEKLGSEGVDPMHIFASISGANLTTERKVKRINLIFKALQIKLEVFNIDFTGCPSPVIINLLSARNVSTQIEVWKLFYEAAANDTAIKAADFNAYDRWKGIDFRSLTILLFWSLSNKYLSLDKHTTTYLEARNIQIGDDRFRDYMQLNKNLQQYNYTDEIFGEQGIYREVVKLAYDVLALKKAQVEISTKLADFFESIEPTIQKEAPEPKPAKSLKKGSKKANLNEDLTNQELISKSKMGFRLIGLKLLDDCSKDITGVLFDKTFIFDNCFTLSEKEIRYHPERDLALYTLNKEKYTELDVNVAALVGKNGSGKSTLTEIIFSILNNVAYNFKSELKKEDLLSCKGICAELYWISSGKLYCLRIVNDLITIKTFSLKEKIFHLENDFINFTWEHFNELFYTISVNYSIYALNSEDLKLWIEKLFHKNDGYQTPVVINPMRTKGNIDINKENKLVRYRLMANLLQQDDIGEASIRNLTPSQRAHEINFKLDTNKNKYLYSSEDDDGNEQFVEYLVIQEQEERILSIVKSVFNIEPYESIEATNQAERYIIRKIISISSLYSKENQVFDYDKNQFGDNEKVTKFLTDIKDENTHKGFKLKQAINFLKYPQLWSREPEFTIEIDKASDDIDKICSQLEEGTYDFNDFLPPPIFDPFIITIKNNNEVIPFEKMSSGEKQLIYSINSILYHLKNIHSVHTDNSGRIKYRNVFLLLDEIELYYHPDLQRTYLFYLLKMIGKMDLSNTITGISVLLVTHSPFILSDIPNQYLLRLKAGKVEPFNPLQKTFGANIYDLLANDFFMDDGYIGKFAMKQINEVLDYVKEGKYTRDKHEQFMKITESIGDEAVNFKLKQLLDRIYNGSTDHILRELEAQKLALEKKIEKMKSNGRN